MSGSVESWNCERSEFRTGGVVATGDEDKVLGEGEAVVDRVVGAGGSGGAGGGGMDAWNVGAGGSEEVECGSGCGCDEGGDGD